MFKQTKKFITTAVLLFIFIAPHQGLALTIPSFFFRAEPVPVYAGDNATVTIIPFNFKTASTTFGWQINGVYNESFSGLGKNFISLKTTTNKQETFTVKVSLDAGSAFEKTERTTVVTTRLLPGQPTAPPSSPPQPPAPTVIAPKTIYNYNFTLKASPSYPSPGDMIRLTVDALGLNLNTAKIKWSVNNKTVLEGTGETTYEFQAGKIGETYNIKAAVTTPDGSVISKTQTIKIVGLSFYWWTDSATPLWYKGKALPSPGSRVKIMAVPDFPEVSADNLIYKWLINDSIASNQSGYGKKTLTISTQFFGVTELISAEVSTPDGSIKKTKDVGVGTVSPLVNIYQSLPLEGVDYSLAAQTLRAAAGSILDFIAEPFFFPKDALPGLKYGWQLNGKDIESKEPAHPNVLSVRTEEGFVPEQNIQILVTNPQRRSDQFFNSLRIKYR